MTTLRDYQQQGFDAITSKVRRGIKRIILVLATGGGKTPLCMEFLRKAAARGVPGLWLCHSDELVSQAASRLAALGLAHGVIQADRPRLDPNALIQIASVQTLVRRANGMGPPASVIVCDEAHRSISPSWQAVLARYPNAVVIGPTASPWRLSGEALDSYWQDIVVAAEPQQLINDGWLIPPVVYAPDVPALEGVPTVAGDYHRSKSAAVMSAPGLVGNVVETYQGLGEGRTAICFAQSVSHSLLLRDRFRAAGVACEHIQAATPRAERRRVLAALASGEVQVVTQVGLLTEGWDLPRCSVVIIARPTQSPGLHRQMVGRGLRPWCPEGCRRACGHEGAKTRCTVLDHAGNHLRHGLVTDPVSYSLTGREKRTGVPGVSVRRCLACFAAFPAALTECPECHTPIPVQPAKPIKEAAGELTELTPARAYALKADQERLVGTLAKFVRTARLKGYKPGWARCAFRGMTNRWPSVAELRRAEEMA